MGRPFCWILLQLSLICVATSTNIHEPYVHYICDESGSNVKIIRETSPPFAVRGQNDGRVNYTDPIDCSLIIHSQEEPLILSLNFASVNIEENENCSSDFLCVHGVRFCGSWLTGHVYKYLLPGDSDFTLVFTSVNWYKDPGFHIIVTAESAINQTVQVVTGGDGSQKDRLVVTDVTYQPGFPYTDRCVNPQNNTDGYTEPAHLSTDEPKTTPENTTDHFLLTCTLYKLERIPLEDITGQGYKIYEPEIYYICQTKELKINSSSPPIRIRIKNHDGYYYDENCAMVIQSGEEALVLSLKYTNFNVEHRDECSRDFLCVQGVRFCGSWLPGKQYSYILPEESKFTLVFKTGSSETYPDLEILFTVSKLDNQSILEPIGGVGSQNYNIQFRPFIYGKSVYMDRCAIYQTEIYHMCHTKELNVNSTSQPFRLWIGNYEYYFSYAYNTDCSVVIQSGDEALVLSLEHIIFKVDHRFDCTRDFLCVQGVRFCGGWPAGEQFSYILPERSKFTLVFKTGPYESYPDLQIFFTVSKLDSQSILEPIGGVGSQKNNIQFRPFIYGKSVYMDRCAEEPVKTFCDESHADGIKINAESPDFKLLNHAQLYAAFQSCSLTLHSGAEALILSLNYNFLNRDPHPTFETDGLCVRGGHFCGKWLSGHVLHYIIPENSAFKLIYMADAWNNLQGFTIKISQEKALKQRFPEATAGRASVIDKFIFAPCLP